jgi:hypothetical protein
VAVGRRPRRRARRGSRPRRHRRRQRRRQPRDRGRHRSRARRRAAPGAAGAHLPDDRLQGEFPSLRHFDRGFFLDREERDYYEAQYWRRPAPIRAIRASPRCARRTCPGSRPRSW